MIQPVLNPPDLFSSVLHLQVSASLGAWAAFGLRPEDLRFQVEWSKVCGDVVLGSAAVLGVTC